MTRCFSGNLDFGNCYGLGGIKGVQTVDVSVSSDPKEMVLPTNFDEKSSIRLLGADILSSD
jgi:hypothetical protein